MKLWDIYRLVSRGCALGAFGSKLFLTSLLVVVRGRKYLFYRFEKYK